jgi:hypothetical protein
VIICISFDELLVQLKLNTKMTMVNDSTPFEVGYKVKWKWMDGHVDGTLVEIHFGSIEKELKGKKIKRNGVSGKVGVSS